MMQPPRNGEEGLTCKCPGALSDLDFSTRSLRLESVFFKNLHANWQHFTGLTTPCNLLSIDSKL
jgi:hypothetical protein